jgi:hypothetical protein
MTVETHEKYPSVKMGSFRARDWTWDPLPPSEYEAGVLTARPRCSMLSVSHRYVSGEGSRGLTSKVFFKYDCE